MTVVEAVSGFLTGYFSTYRRSEKTRAAYRIDLAQMKTHLGTTAFEEVEVGELERWATEFRARGYALDP